MALREIKVGDQTILVEVTDVQVEGQTPGTPGGFEYTSVDKQVGDVKDRIAALLSGLAAPVQEGLQALGPEEWTLELSLGFKGGTGIPFLASAEANGAVKVTAKWKKGS